MKNWIGTGAIWRVLASRAMVDEPNPYEAPAPGWNAPAEGSPAVGEELGSVHHTLAAQLVKPKEEWKIDLHDRHLRFVAPDGETIAFDRAEFPEHVDFALLGGGGLLTVTAPIRRVFKVPHEDLGTMKSWFGPDLRIWMTAVLKKRRRFSWITGALIGGLGLMSGDLVLIGYAALVGLFFVGARFAPHRALFLGDAALNVLLGIFVAYGMYLGTWSYWWGLFFLFVLFSVGVNVRMFGFFGRS